MISTIFHDPGDTLQARHEQRRRAARQRWHEYPRSDIESRGGFLVDRATGHLFERINHVVFASGHALDNEGKDCAGFVDLGGDLMFLRRASGPSTVAELEAQEAARARQQQEREQAHADFIASQPLRTVTLAEFESRPEQVPTLRQAVSQLYDLGGHLEADGPDLLVRVPERLAEDPNADYGARQTLPPLVRVIAAGRNVILDELAKGGKQPLPDRLPDRHVGAAGGLA